jgi:hypothetical protein
MSRNMRELTDGELDSVSGGHSHHHHHQGSSTGGRSFGGGSTGFLGASLGHDLILSHDIIFINIGNTVGAEIGQQLNGALSLNGIGV